MDTDTTVDVVKTKKQGMYNLFVSYSFRFDAGSQYFHGSGIFIGAKKVNTNEALEDLKEAIKREVVGKHIFEVVITNLVILDTNYKKIDENFVLND